MEIAYPISLLPFGNRDDSCTICANMVLFGAIPGYWEKIQALFPVRDVVASSGHVYFSSHYVTHIRRCLVAYNPGIPARGAVFIQEVFETLCRFFFAKRVIDLTAITFIETSYPRVEKLFSRIRENGMNQVMIYRKREIELLGYSARLPLEVGAWKLRTVLIYITGHVFTLVKEGERWCQYDDHFNIKLTELKVKQWIQGTVTGKPSSWYAAFYAKAPLRPRRPEREEAHSSLLSSDL